MTPTKSHFTVLQQICKLIPAYLVPKLAREHGVDKKARGFTPWSHVVAMTYVHLAHALSLNDVADALRNHSAAVASIRGATPTSRNGLSHANRVRNADMAEDLFWKTLEHIQKTHPKFGIGHKYSGVPRRFKRAIHAVDSTLIKLMAKCLPWAKHRRRKAAAKCHMRLNLQTFIPSFAIVKSANTHDSTEAWELCADLLSGEIALFDKAYIEFSHLYSLDQREVFWVTRAKDNMDYRVVGQHTAPKGNIHGDYLIELTGSKSAKGYPKLMRLVIATVKINNKDKVMTFITNNMDWAPSSVCDLYLARWGIEVFFKQIKQTLQLSDFLGYSENAIRWQLWMALLVYILLRYIGYLGKWKGSFRRLFTLLRGVLFSRLDMFSVLESCGTAGGRFRIRASPERAYLPGFENFR